MARPVIEVQNLTVSIRDAGGGISPVDGVSFGVAPGRTLAIVGESGSGKSLTCLALVGGLPRAAKVAEGRVVFEGEDLLSKSEAELNAIRGRKIGIVLQDPMTSLNPLLTVGGQIGEMFVHHERTRGRREVRAKVISAMQAVQIPSAELRADHYPHQFSGGMRQRIAIAMAIACRPSLLIADEPTTALDATIRLQILRLLRDIQRRTGMAIIFVTHDLNLVRHFCDEVAVMYAGRIVEHGPVAEVFGRPSHPYAAALIGAAPRLLGTATTLATIDGQPPRFNELPPGCRFAPRCSRADERCRSTYPETDFVGGSLAACWKPLETRLEAAAS
jgi:oligopeptide/dipeptide ABC transporter ATP-binding protein